MLIHVLGDAFCDIVASNVQSLPPWNGAALADGIRPFAGGSGVNTAVQLSSFANKHFSVTLFTALGDDWACPAIVQHLKNYDIQLKAAKKQETGKCIVLSGPEGRSFISTPGAMREFCLEDINVDELATCDHLHICGIFCMPALAPQLPLLLHAVRERNPNLTISMDMNFDETGQWGSEWLPLCFPLLDMLKLNEEEALLIGKVNRQETLAFFGKQVRKGCVITSGERGATSYFTEDGTIKETPACTIPKVVDHTGAGDAWCAGFIVGYFLEQFQFHDSVEWGNVFGAHAVTSVGGCDHPMTGDVFAHYMCSV